MANLSQDSSKSDWGQYAFDAGKRYRLSGEDYSSGVANARVVKYGFLNWMRNEVLPFKNDRLPRGVTQAYMLTSFREGYAAGKRTGSKKNPSVSAASGQLNTWIKASAVRVRKVAGKLLVDLKVTGKPGRSRNPSAPFNGYVVYPMGVPEMTLRDANKEARKQSLDHGNAYVQRTDNNRTVAIWVGGKKRS